LTDVFETHIHNDYVTGGLALAKATGALAFDDPRDRRGRMRGGGDAALAGAMDDAVALAHRRRVPDRIDLGV
jgi:glyoxylase-like metal-dependent hydrolase (beta-lactamase superfamily II)